MMEKSSINLSATLRARAGMAWRLSHAEQDVHCQLIETFIL